MDGKSQNIREQQLSKLKELFPEVVSDGKVDWEKLKLTLGEDTTIDNERYVLNWAGKSDAFRAIQTQTTATLKPQREQSVDFDTTQNIFIEGENLEVLKVLQKSYYGKVKMIYIDPPYNTGNDSFIYPDKFSESKDEYLKRIGDKDEAGYLTKEGFFRKNSKENGQYHSNWLSMMYPRLFLARNLLLDDGVIFVSIDDNEMHNLRLMMNEVFGEENFVAAFVWFGGRKNDSKQVSVSHEYILSYGKSSAAKISSGNVWKEKKEGIDRIYSQYEKLKRKYGKDWSAVSEGLQEWYRGLKPYDPAKEHEHYHWADKEGVYFASDISGPDDGRKNRPRYEVLHPVTKKPVQIPARGWRWEYPRMQEELAADRVHFGPDESSVPNIKVYLRENEYQAPSSVFYRDRRGASADLKGILQEKVFDFPKDAGVIRRLISLVTYTDSIVLDFFAGSGTTAQAVMELNKEDGGNRKFILIQLPEKIDEESDAYKANYKTIADICRVRIRRVSEKINEEIETQRDLFKDKSLDLGFKAFTLEPSTFKVWRTDTIENGDDLKKQMDAFTDPVKTGSDANDMAWEILVKSGYELTTKMEKRTVGNVAIYSIAEGEIALALEKITQKAIAEVVKMKPKNFICLDRLFAGNDQLKTNTALQMKDAGVEFRTI
ncbi:MAG TPA: site-specific DNA-methyltransferase [Candidatus Acidoferrales bacterium]|nr:site-specific DNA-methyltransferase [Candidatus Acidoferrales bacterium]